MRAHVGLIHRPRCSTSSDRRRPPPGIEPSLLALLLEDAAPKKWVVYAKRPAQVLRYVARYTHKIAISDPRIVAVDERTVTFTYKDYRDGHETKLMRLDAHEWLRRFTTHVLPRGSCACGATASSRTRTRPTS